MLDNAAVLSTAFFRDPMSRYASAFNYATHHSPHVSFDQHVHIRKWDNVATKMMLGHSEDSEVTLNDALFRRAKQQVDKLNFIGIVEHIEASFQRYCRHFLCPFPDYMPKHERVSKKAHPAWSEATTAVFKTNNVWDLRLYDYVVGKINTPSDTRS